MLPFDILVYIHRICDVQTRLTLQQAFAPLKRIRYRLVNKPNIVITDEFVGLLVSSGDTFDSIILTPKRITRYTHYVNNPACFIHIYHRISTNITWDPWIEKERSTGHRHLLRAMHVQSAEPIQPTEPL